MRFRYANLVASVSLLQGLGLSAPHVVKVCFVKDGQVYVANADGLQARRVSTDEGVKAMPKWSPDGERIVYLDTKREPNSLGVLVVVDVNGSAVGRYPVSTVAADGTEIGGMRFVESIGWMDSSHVFAEGSANPHAGEYRAIDVASGKLSGFIGTGFATCPQNGAIAYWLPVFPPSTAMTLQLLRHTSSTFTFPDWNALPDIHVKLAWDKSCRVLAFVDARQPPHLVLVVGGRVQRRIPLPGAVDSRSIRTVDGGFLLGVGAALFYNVATSKVMSTPASILAAARAVDVLEQRLSSALGASEIDYTEVDK